MRFYTPGDAIYIFGFSRGAYTARFLADMISVVGLLSQGNEDMVRFAFGSYSEVLRKRGKINKTPKEKEHERYLEHFKKTFCRPHVQVHFLGLFDCVNGVGQFEIPFRRQSYRYIARVRERSFPVTFSAMLTMNIAPSNAHPARSFDPRTSTEIQTCSIPLRERLRGCRHSGSVVRRQPL